MNSLYSHLSGSGKHSFCLFLSLLWLATACPAGAQAAQKVVIPRASQVVLSHVGVHSHANFLLFDTGSLDVLKIRQNPARFPRLTLRAHSSLPTDHAALPPDLAAFSSPGDPPLDNPYGPIDGGSGKPGWTLLPVRQNGKNLVRVLVPTRFANWLALQPPLRRRLYLQPKSYTLTISWE